MNEQYLKTIITVTMPWFGSTATAEYITKMGLGGDCKDITVKPKRGMVTAKVLQFTFDHYRDAMARSFVSSLAKVFNPEYLKVEVKTAPAFADDWELFEHLLKGMDWYYQFSDDHRVWCAGENAIARLKQLRLSLSKSYEGKVRADALWEKYAK
jgi:hypothetical protein